jgi:DHA1 family purine base/nucleoside efflux pump-like MFS transporter
LEPNALIEDDCTACSSDRDLLSLPQTAGFALSMFLVGSFFLALSPILPDVARDLDADTTRLGYPGGAYGLALGLTSVALAPFHDIVSRRIMLAVGMSLHLVGLICVALSPTWAVLVLGHALCGCGGGIFMPAAYAAISDRTSEATRARILGRVNSGWAASTLVGVPAAAFLGESVGWRGMMLVLATTWLIIAALTARLFTANDRPGGAVVAISAFWSRSIRSRIHAARLPWLFLSTVLTFIGFYGVYAYLGIAIRGDLGVQAGGAGIFVSIYGLGFLTGTLNGWIIDRVGPERSLSVATAALGMILLSIPHTTHSMVLLGLTMYLWGVFQNAAFTSFTTAIGKVDTAIRGRAFSINTACVFTGSSIGTATMGVVIATMGFVTVGIICMAATVAASVIVTCKLAVARQGIRLSHRE